MTNPVNCAQNERIKEIECDTRWVKAVWPHLYKECEKLWPHDPTMSEIRRKELVANCARYSAFLDKFG